MRIQLEILNGDLRRDLTFLLKCELDRKRFVLVEKEGDLTITDGTPKRDRLSIKISSIDEVKELVHLFKEIKLKFITKPRSVVVGIDPGKRLGCALLVDGRISGSYVADSPSDLVRVLCKFLEFIGLKKEEVLVKIGKGPRFDELTSHLEKSGFSRILVVGEEGSSSRGSLVSRQLKGDVNEEEASALIIAIREP